MVALAGDFMVALARHSMAALVEASMAASAGFTLGPAAASTAAQQLDGTAALVSGTDRLLASASLLALSRQHLAMDTTTDIPIATAALFAIGDRISGGIL